MWIYQGRREQIRLHFPFPFLWHISKSSEPIAVQCWGPHPHPCVHAPLPVTSHRVEMRRWRGKGLSTLHFYLYQACIQAPQKAPWEIILSINSIKTCSAELCSSTETFCLPVRWVMLHENWLFQANPKNTCYCILMRQYTAIYCTSSRNSTLLSFPCL